MAMTGAELKTAILNAIDTLTNEQKLSPIGRNLIWEKIARKQNISSVALRKHFNNNCLL